jgi:hypothetical protein
MSATRPPSAHHGLRLDLRAQLVGRPVGELYRDRPAHRRPHRYPSHLGPSSLLYGVVWGAVALGLVVLDGWLWGGPTPSSAKGLPAYGGESQVS